MAKRAEAERDLTPAEQEALPPHDRVPTQEAGDWEERVKARIGETCDEDTQARLAAILEIRSDDIRKADSDNYTPMIAAWRRIVELRTNSTRGRPLTSESTGPQEGDPNLRLAVLHA